MTGKDRTANDMTAKDLTKRKLDERLEGALEDTFPASDPIAVIEPAPTLPEDDFVPESKTGRAR
jgi:hypothetical protein